MNKEVRTTFIGIKAGQKFKVIGNTNQHNYGIGKTYKFNESDLIRPSK